MRNQKVLDKKNRVERGNCMHLTEGETGYIHMRMSLMSQGLVPSPKEDYTDAQL